MAHEWRVAQKWIRASARAPIESSQPRTPNPESGTPSPHRVLAFSASLVFFAFSLASKSAMHKRKVPRENAMEGSNVRSNVGRNVRNRAMPAHARVVSWWWVISGGRWARPTSVVVGLLLVELRLEFAMSPAELLIQAGAAWCMCICLRARADAGLVRGLRACESVRVVGVDGSVW